MALTVTGHREAADAASSDGEQDAVQQRKTVQQCGIVVARPQRDGQQQQWQPDRVDGLAEIGAAGVVGVQDEARHPVGRVIGQRAGISEIGDIIVAIEQRMQIKGCEMERQHDAENDAGAKPTGLRWKTEAMPLCIQGN